MSVGHVTRIRVLPNVELAKKHPQALEYIECMRWLISCSATTAVASWR
jgi:hypothetical protein